LSLHLAHRLDGPPLTPEEEHTLIVEWQRSHDERIALRIIGGMFRVALKLSRLERNQLDWGEYLSLICLALMLSLHKYDPARKVRFSSYAVHAVRRALRRGIVADAVVRPSYNGRHRRRKFIVVSLKEER
jgi:DNA-directed RNA polymerase specialized sigma subunit